MKRLMAVFTIVASLLVMPVASFADNSAMGQQVSLGQAVQMAQQNSISLIRAANANQQAQKTFENTTFNGFTPITTGMSNPYVPAPTDTQSAINSMQLNYNWQYSSKNIDYLKNSTTYQTLYDYLAIQDAIKAEQVAEKSLQQAQVTYNNTMAQSYEGMATDAQVQSAKSGLDSAQSALVSAKSAIDNAYVTFDTLVGLDTKARPELNTQIDYQKDNFFYAIDLTGAIGRAVSTSPTVFQDQTSVSVNSVNQYYNTTPDVGPLQYQDAQNKLAQDEQTVTQQTTSAYTALDTTEKAYVAAQKALTAAQSAYKNAQVNYNVGISTKLDLVTAEASLAKAELAVQQALHGIYDARGNLALSMGVGPILPTNLPDDSTTNQNTNSSTSPTSTGTNSTAADQSGTTTGQSASNQTATGTSQGSTDQTTGSTNANQSTTSNTSTATQTTASN